MSKNQILSIKEEDTMLSENLRDVEKKIEGACIRSGKSQRGDFNCSKQDKACGDASGGL